MEKYIDGYLLSVATAELQAYRKWPDWRAPYGWNTARWTTANAAATNWTTFASFTKAAGAGPDETVVFAWILFASKAERDRINALAMSDPRLANMECGGIFDPKRMCWGGFTSMIGS